MDIDTTNEQLFLDKIFDKQNDCKEILPHMIKNEFSESCDDNEQELYSQDPAVNVCDELILKDWSLKEEEVGVILMKEEIKEEDLEDQSSLTADNIDNLNFQAENLPENVTDQTKLENCYQEKRMAAQNFGKSKTQGESKAIGRRGQIVSLWKGGKRIEEIMHEVGCSRKTAWRWIDRYQEEGDLSTRPKTGAPRKTTPEQDHAIVQRSIDDPKKTAKDIAVEENLNFISPYTVRSRVHESGQHHRDPASKEELSQRNRQDR